jgi:L-lactate dehydrogenase complex protein LldF
MGITGANFLVADTGMIALTSNEGNARLCSSIPRIHVAIAGIEKIIPRLEDLAILWPVLANRGTGQPMTCYNTLIGGPHGPSEIDGPEEFHVVLLDNGRSDLLADPEQREVLNCIRCGACLNVCPVYRTVGGHAYGTTYQGPIGSVLTPHLRGIKEFQHLSSASSLCGACTETCPVKIDLHHHLLHNRRNAVESKNRSWFEQMGFKVWSWSMRDSGRLAFFGALTRAGLRSINALGLAGTALDPARAWTKDRAALRVPQQSFRAAWEKQEKD